MAYQEEIEELNAFGGALYRRTKEGAEYIHGFKNFEQLNEDWIKENFGGGNYFLKCYYLDDEDKKRQKMVEVGLIAGAKKANENEEGENMNNEKIESVLNGLTQQMQLTNQALIKMMDKINSPKQTESTDILLKIIEMQNKNQKENFEMFMRGLEMGRDLNSSDDDNNDDGELKSMLGQALGGLMGGKTEASSAGDLL